MLETERKTYKKRHSDLVRSSLGKFALIKGDELIGTFNTLEEALQEGARRFGLDSFLVREVRKDVEAQINIPALSLGILSANSTRPV